MAVGLGTASARHAEHHRAREYLRLNLGAETYATIVGPVRTEIDTNILRVGMSYKF
jgi:hypothetical protein